MLEAGAHKVLPVIPQLIIPIKTALNTREKVVIVKVFCVYTHIYVFMDVSFILLVYIYMRIYVCLYSN
jgi:hypothetical protein